MSVVAFPDRGQGPYIEGPVRCLGCKHEWRAVAPPGVFDHLECPQCSATKGIRLGVILPDAGTIWECACGADLFFLTPAGAPLCANCGLRATGWADG